MNLSLERIRTAKGYEFYMEIPNNVNVDPDYVYKKCCEMLWPNHDFNQEKENLPARRINYEQRPD